MRAITSRLWSRLGREVLVFGIVGALAFVIDVGVFNLLRSHDAGPLTEKPVTAKIISASLATLFSYAGNRWWTYRHRPRSAVLRELVLFFVMNGLALLISVLCLAVSHYVLQMRSALADNISANFIGVLLGTAFRFVAYRYWVFRKGTAEPGEPQDAVGELAHELPARRASSRASTDADRRPTSGRGQEQRERRRMAAQQLEPTALGRDEVPRQR